MRSLRLNNGIAIIPLLAYAAGCQPADKFERSQSGLHTQSTHASPAKVSSPPLSGAAAKSALLELIRTKPDGLKWASHTELSEAAVVDNGKGMAWFGPFYLDLNARTYDFRVEYGQQRVCTWFYQGSFDINNGKWAALPPRLLSQALGPAIR